MATNLLSSYPQTEAAGIPGWYKLLLSKGKIPFDKDRETVYVVDELTGEILRTRTDDTSNYERLGADIPEGASDEVRIILNLQIGKYPENNPYNMAIIIRNMVECLKKHPLLDAH